MLSIRAPPSCAELTRATRQTARRRSSPQWGDRRRLSSPPQRGRPRLNPHAPRKSASELRRVRIAVVVKV
ncbi:unnamed protein product, partial [Iphiclides podalirius]